MLIRLNLINQSGTIVSIFPYTELIYSCVSFYGRNCIFHKEATILAKATLVLFSLVPIRGVTQQNKTIPLQLLRTSSSQSDPQWQQVSSLFRNRHPTVSRVLSVRQSPTTTWPPKEDSVLFLMLVISAGICWRHPWLTEVLLRNIPDCASMKCLFQPIPWIPFTRLSSAAPSKQRSMQLEVGTTYGPSGPSGF